MFDRVGAALRWIWDWLLRLWANPRVRSFLKQSLKKLLKLLVDIAIKTEGNR